MTKPINYYDDFIMATTHGDKPSDIVGKEPRIVKKLADDVDFELYVGDSGQGKDTWATAVILVKYKGGTYRWKYDGGHINNDLEEMALECLANIRVSWDLNMWRQYAKEEYEKRQGFMARIKRIFYEK